MRRLIVLLALPLLGCSGNLVGPFENRRPQRVDDPCVSIPEQEIRGRDRLAIPVEWPDGDRMNLAPQTYIDRPSPSGR
jgi:hypothetical protein